MNEMPGLPTVPCLCFDAAEQEDAGCACGNTERVLRHVTRGRVNLTPEQREWCLQEIDTHEGETRRTWEGLPDSEVAHGVLNAWTDYCRDKGLL